MAHFARHLRELGERIDGSFLALRPLGHDSVEDARDDARRAGRPGTTSRPTPSGEVPFYKRAQIAAGDLALAGSRPRADLHRLTLFADNLVPHVLRIDGVLGFDDDLVARIDAGVLLEHDSPGGGRDPRRRAARGRAARPAHPGNTTATALDKVAVDSAAPQPRYKAHPRHRAPTTAY